MRASELVRLQCDKWDQEAEEMPDDTWAPTWVSVARRAVQGLIEKIGDVEINVRIVPPEENQDRDPS